MASVYRLRSTIATIAATIALCSMVFGLDSTLDSEVTGTDVVHAVITRLSTCNLTKFNYSDHRILRRIAYVETRDGNRPLADSVELYGIWAVSEVTVNVALRGINIEERCGYLNSPDCSLSSLSKPCLRKPLYSGLIAKLYLHTYEPQIPLSDNITGQAQFWVKHYRGIGGRKPKCFENAVRALNLLEGCLVKADIFFVLDASMSIEAPDFEKALKFEEEFVTGLTIGPDDDRVGTITFGNCAHIVFNLSTYSSKSDLITAIRSITQVQGGTHTADGLCKLNQSLVEARHSDTVLRIAIVMSDGRSNLNDKSNDCRWTTTKAAAEIHKLKPPVLVYVVGVSDGVDDEELKAISTSDSYIHIDNFTKIQLLADHYVDDICTKATVNIPSETLIDGNLTDSQVVRYALTIPYLGVTVHVCALQGVIQLYVSTTFPNPNSALFDFMLTLDCSIMCQDNSTCGDLYIPGSEFMHKKSKLSLHQRVRSVEFQSKRDNFVYISVRGALAVTNSFTLNLTEGDIPGDCVGEMVATDCGDTTVSPSPTTTSTVTLPPTSDPTTPGYQSKSNRVLLVIATVSSSGLLLLILAIIIALICACGCAVHRRKKQEQAKEEDEFGLLDNQYAEM